MPLLTHDRNQNIMKPLTFTLGEENLALRDLHQGIGVYGGLSTGKTVAITIPILREIFWQLIDEKPNTDKSKCGGFIIDKWGDLARCVKHELTRAGRPIEDLIEISLKSETKYHPFGKENSEEEIDLKKLQAIKLGGSKEIPEAFQKETNLDFRSIFNEGKIVVLNGEEMSKSEFKTIASAMKFDFQKFQRDRIPLSAKNEGINVTRTVLFLCDEYQEYATESDNALFYHSRATRTACVILCHTHNALELALGDKGIAEDLCQKIGTWVFLRTTDAATAERGHRLISACKRGLFQTLPEKEEFSRLPVITMETTKGWPWYSTGIIHRNVNPTPKFRKTKIHHLYYTNKESPFR